LQFINNNALPAINAFTDAFSITGSAGFGKVISDVAGILKSIVTPIFNAFKDTFDRIKKTVIENKDEFAAFFDVIKAAAPVIGRVLGDAFSAIGKVADVVLNVIANVLGAIKPLINTAIDGINLLIRGINLVKPGSDIQPIPKIGGSTGSTTTGALGNFSMTTGMVSSTPSGAGVTTTSSGLVTGGATTTSSGLVTGGGSVATVAAKAAAAITNIAGAFDNFTSGTTTLAGIEAASNRGFPFGTSGVNTNTLAGIMAASAPTINVTVNGAIDKEGTARTIVDTLNNSFYRGTGGANNLQLA
jgi:phage-related protein